MADKDLTFKLFGVDVSASKALKGVGSQADKTARDVEAGSRREAIAREKAQAAADKAAAAQERGARRSAAAMGALGVAASAAAAAAIAAAAAAAAAFGAGVKDAIAYEQQAAKLAAAIQATGNAAHVSVAGLQEHAAKLESLSGVDEMAIQSAEELLTAYRNVRNNAGAGNDIFNQATAAALDMSIKKSMDLGKATQFVGRSLNDPVAGMAKLRAQGVLLTKQQQDQIGAFVKAGEVAKAQKIILDGLSKSYGGAAAGQGSGPAGAMARAKDAVSDGFRDLGRRALPAITEISNAIAANAGPAFQRLGDIISDATSAVSPLVGWVRDQLMPALREAAANALPAVQNAFGMIRDAVNDMKPALAQVGMVITKVVIPTVGILANLMATELGLAFKAVSAIATNVVVPAFMWVAEGAADALKALAVVASKMLGLAARAAEALGQKGVAASLRSAAASVDGYAKQMDSAIQAIRNRVVTVTIATVEVKGISMGQVANLQRQAGSANDREGRSASASDIAAVAARPKATVPSFGGGGGYSGMSLPKGGGGGSSAKSAAREAVAGDLADLAAALKESRKKAGEEFAKLAGDVSKAGSAAARRIVDSYAKIVLPLAQKYEAITKSLKAAQDKLAKIRDDAKQYAADVKRSVVEGSKLGEQESVGGIVNSLKESISYAQQFAATLAKLKALGADATTIQQLVAAGPQQGLKLGEQLAATGKSGVAQVAGLQSQLNAAANSLGAGASNSMYSAGIAAAQGLVKGLASQQSALAKQMATLANAMVTAIKKALKIKSPSQVFEQVGVYSGAGLVKGLEGQYGAVQSAAGRMMGAIGANGARTAALAAAPSTRGGDIHVHGALIDSSDLHRLTQQARRRQAYVGAA